MTVKVLETKLAKLEVLQELFKDKKPGWDQKVRCDIITLIYNSSLECFLQSHIAEVKEAIRWHYIQEMDEE